MKMILEYFIIILLTIALVWISIKHFRLKTGLEERARALYEHWRDSDLCAITSSMETRSSDTINREVELRSREWKHQEEVKIRQDAIRRSREVIHGKVTEHLIPFFPSFPWNPADARFLGSPIDFVVFDGLSEGMVREVILVEVKSGARRALSPRERSVEQCIRRGAVSFRIIHPDDR